MTGAVRISFPSSGWSFTATQLHPPQPRPPTTRFPCTESIPAGVKRLDENTWTLRPGGPPDRYEVRLQGEGPQGAVSVAFALTTTTSGPMPNPDAWAQVFNRGGGVPKTGGHFFLTLTHLATTPDDVKATLRVTAKDGQTSTYQLQRPERECRPRGVAYLRTRAPKADVADTIGPPPYDLQWVLHLDGNRYKAQASWPGDQRGVDRLIYPEFRPTLPAWSSEN